MAYKSPEDYKRWRRETHARRRAEWMKDKKCEWCGATERLELDHINRDRAKRWSNVWLWTAERREAELAKCRVLCWSCHRKRHGDEIRCGHGTHRRYVKGCRCDECKAAHAEKAREYRAANKARHRAKQAEYNRRWREKKRKGRAT